MDGAIRARTVLVIDSASNENLGLMSLGDALRRASEQGLNLMQMGAAQPGQPPTCKILDYGKFRYDESKRLKAQAKKQRESQIEEKEISFRPDTAINDLKTKARQAMEFLDEGAKVKINIRCRGREVNNSHHTMITVKQFIELIPNGVLIPVSVPPVGSGTVRFSYMIERVNSKEKKSG